MSVATPGSLMTLGRAWPRVQSLIDACRNACGDVEELVPAGDLRRFTPVLREVELVAAAGNAREAIRQLSGLPLVTSTLQIGSRRAVLEIENMRMTVSVVSPATFGAALIRRTGSRRHLSGLRAHAASTGATLRGQGKIDRDAASTLGTEDDCYASLGLPWIPPELREGRGEIEAAAGGRLPELLTPAAIRGDLHMHTDWSDGRDSLDAMLAAAAGLGYEYVAVTDHSITSASARGLDAQALERQRDAVARSREDHPGMTILHGAEVDILPDGRLDFDDRTLERLDIVLASLHDAAGQSRRQLTDRYIAAMRHPLVHVVTHPTNRLVPSRPGYELDEDRLFEAAVESGTAIEVDGAPGHLDMDGEMTRRAVAAGVSITVDGDCHRADLLGRQMLFGVSTARRGWVEPRHVVNTLSTSDLRRWLLRKRQSG